VSADSKVKPLLSVTFTYRPADTVHLIGLNIPGTVTGCLVDSDGLQYRVVWWWDGLRHCEWLQAYELGPCV
jgi:hypothetical protein